MCQLAKGWVALAGWKQRFPSAQHLLHYLVSKCGGTTKLDHSVSTENVSGLPHESREQQQGRNASGFDMTDSGVGALGSCRWFGLTGN